MNTLDQLSSAALSADPAQPAIEFDHQWISWGEMRKVAQRLNELIDASGARANGKIAFVARNRPSALAAFLGMLEKRRSIRMVYPFQSGQAIAREIERINPAVLVAADEDYCEPIFSALREAGGAAIALTEMAATCCSGFEKAGARTDTATAPQIEILTSGTTGAPKPFALSYDTIARHIVAYSAAPSGLKKAPQSTIPALLYFPVSNISGLYTTLPALLSGQSAVLLDRFSVAGWHDHLLRFRPAFGGLPPAGVQMVLDADIPVADLSCLSGIGTGAAPLDSEVQRAFEQRYGVPILVSYGATEFGGPVTRMTPDVYTTWGDAKLGSVGRAIPGVQLRVIDPDSGETLPPGQEGILEVVSPRIGPNWIRTADIVLIDEDGFMFHRGRADGAIMRGGFKLLPTTIEHALLQHPAISAAAVVGIADQRLGQVPAAVLQLKPGVDAPSVADIEAHLRSHVPATHIPVAWRFVESLPRTPSMKTDQPAVRRLFETQAPVGAQGT